MSNKFSRIEYLCIICVLLLLLLLASSFGWNESLPEVTVSEQVAHADNNVPVLTLTGFPLSDEGTKLNYYGEEQVVGNVPTIINRLELDISTNRWLSTSIADRKYSLIYHLGINIAASSYHYTRTDYYYTGEIEGNQYLVDASNLDIDNPNVQIMEGDAYPECMYPLYDSEHVTVTGIYISGETWYGQTVTDQNVLLNDGEDVVAGLYYVSKVTGKYNYQTEYITGAVGKGYNYSVKKEGQDYKLYSAEGGKDDELIETKTTLSKVKEPFTVEFKDSTNNNYNTYLFLQTTVTVGSRDRALFHNGLNLNVTYDGETQFADRITLLDKTASAYPTDGQSFTYSIMGDSAQYFYVERGMLPSLTGQFFGMDAIITGTTTIADKFFIEWYSDDAFDNKLEAEDTVQAGKYYLRIIGRENGDTYIGATKKTYAVSFVISDWDEPSLTVPYSQEVELKYISLKVSFVDGIGANRSVDESGKIIGSTPYAGRYSKAKLFYDVLGEAMPAGEFYEKKGSDYVPSTKTKFKAEEGEELVLYRKRADASAMFGNRLNDLVQNDQVEEAKDMWMLMGGRESDWSVVYTALFNGEGSIVSYDGSYFPDVLIATYNYVNLYVSVGISELRVNYRIELGYFSGNEWNAYPQEPMNNSSYLMPRTDKDGNYIAGKGEDGNSLLDAYYVVGTFQVLPPEVSLNFSEFQKLSAFYGEVLSAADIDFSAVFLDGNGTTLTSVSGESQTYKIDTAEDKWKIKIINDESQRLPSSEYNYVYVCLSLGKVSSSTQRYNYQSEQGTGYTRYEGTLYAGYPLPGSNEPLGQYYIIFTLSYMRIGDTTATALDRAEYGKAVAMVHNDDTNSDSGIVAVSLNTPSGFYLNPIKIYVNLTDYEENKYYDGNSTLLKADGKPAGFRVEVDTPAGYVLAPGLVDAGVSSILEYDLRNSLKTVVNIDYSSRMAVFEEDEYYNVGCTLSLEGISGLDLVVKDSLINSYEPQENLRHTIYTYDSYGAVVSSVISSDPVLGKVLPLTLDLHVLDNPAYVADESSLNYVSQVQYYRSYNHKGLDMCDYVAIRVARYDQTNYNGETLLQIYQSSHPALVSSLRYYADYYYVYDRNYEGGNEDDKYRFCFFRDLPGLFDEDTGEIKYDVGYIFMEIDEESATAYHGFLRTDERYECFNWDPTRMASGLDVVAFNADEYGAVQGVDACGLFIDWANALERNPESGVYDELQDDYKGRLNIVNWNAGLYKLTFFEDIRVSNYRVAVVADNPNVFDGNGRIGYEVLKVKLSPSDVFPLDDEGNLRIVNPEESDLGRELIYDKTAKINSIYTSNLLKTFIDISRHPAYNDRENGILVKYGGSPDDESIVVNFADASKNNNNPTIIVTSFTRGKETPYDLSDDEVVDRAENLTNEMKNMVLAGEYVFTVKTPATRNYEEVVVDNAVITVHCATVTVYATSVIRTYMFDYSVENEVKLDENNPAKFLSLSELNTYYAYVEENDPYDTTTDSSGYQIIAYFKNDNPSCGEYDLSAIHVYYVGLVEGDEFGGAPDEMAHVELDYSVFLGANGYEDAAGFKEEYKYFIGLSGAKKQNYIFDYRPGALFVKMQNFIIHVDGNQTANYTGKSLSPEYSVETEEGNGNLSRLEQFIAGYYAKTSSGDVLYVKDFQTNVNNEVTGYIWRNAVMSLGPSEDQMRDYHFYFEEFYDDGTQVEVMRDGEEIYFYKNTVKTDLFLIGGEYFYNNGSRRIRLTYRQYPIYNDNGTHYYYDSTSTRVNLSRAVKPDYENTFEDKRVSYVDVVDGKLIFVAINHSELAPSNDKDPINVFYDQDGNRGGYLLKIRAFADEAKGASPDNFKTTAFQIVSYEIRVLDLYLTEHDLGTGLNPLWIDEFRGSTDANGDPMSYETKGLSEYYEGRTGNGTVVQTDSFWATVEVEVVDDLPQLMYAYSDELDLETEGLLQFTNYLNGSGENGFNFAQSSTARINDAGFYMVLMKVTIKDNLVQEGQEAVNMRRNIRFADNSTQTIFYDAIKTPSDTFVAYFVLFLIIDRTNDIVINIKTNANRATPTPIDGVDLAGGYEKTYDKEEITFALYEAPGQEEEENNSGVLALGKPTAKGNILNSRAYLSTGPDYYSSVKGTYFLAERGVYETVWEENKQINLIHVNQFYLTVIVNYDDREEAGRMGLQPTYDGNYATVVKIYQVNIIKRILPVYIMIKETDNEGNVHLVEPTAENCGKHYGEQNSDVEGRLFGYMYGDADDLVWAQDKASLEALIVDPVINWELVSTISDPEGRYIQKGSYGITPTGGQEPMTKVVVINEEFTFWDYEFDYNSARNRYKTTSRDFVIWSLQLRVGEEPPCVRIEDSIIYKGEQRRPIIYIYGWDGDIVYYKANEGEVLEGVELSEGHSEVFSDVQIVLLGRIRDEVYDPNHTYTFSDANDFSIVDQDLVSAINCGHYLFQIHIGSSDSLNYLGLEEDVVWVFTIEKKELELVFVDENGDKVRGFAEMTYGTGGDYPSFSVRYSGFEGADIVPGDYGTKKVYYGIENFSDEADIAILNLFNPVYVFVDEQGEILKDPDGNYTRPTNAGTYYIALLNMDLLTVDEGICGYANNYIIKVSYYNDLYPEMAINPRRVGIQFIENVNQRITKEYNARNNVIENSVSPASAEYAGNYTFSSLSGDTGLIPGDTIGLQINYADSKYARSTVYDENEERTPIVVYVAFEEALRGTDAANYVLDYDGLCEELGTKYVDEGGARFLKLWGTITQARATIRFLNDNNQSVTTYRVVYNGESRPANVRVEGVELYDDHGLSYELLTFENGDYTIWYNSDRSNWDSALAPVNCDTYEVTVTITNKNYYETPSTSYLVITQADVEIIFGGDGIQMYGNVTSGLSAIATGVHDYRVSLAVTYYVQNEDGSRGDIVEDIATAKTGTYFAVAFHAETDNFAEKYGTEILTIARREIEIKYDIAPTYKYSGGPVSVRMYFEYQGDVYYPDLLFDKWDNGVWNAVNYTIGADGSAGRIVSSPSGVGTYRVRAFEILDDFVVVNPVWVTFSIEKANLIVRANDLTFNQGDTISLSASMVNCLTSDTIAKVVSNLNYKVYDAVTGATVVYWRVAGAGGYRYYDATNTREIGALGVWNPDPGTYRVECYGGESNNYTLSYRFGLLTIHKTSIVIGSQTGNTSTQDDVPQIMFEGSFPSDMQVNVTETKNTQYSEITDAFNTFKENNADFAGYRLQNVYVFEYVNYSASVSKKPIRIKLYMADLFAKAEKNNRAENEEIRMLKAADNETYYVAILADDGSLSVTEGRREGDYLCFDSSERTIKAISVLTDEEAKISSQFDWMLYVGIAVGVALIALAIVIVLKKE